MERSPKLSMHGRGAQSAATSQRFGLPEREVDGDWRDYVQQLDGPPVKLRTSVTEEHPRSIISFNNSPDL
ncbi:MAG: radical SAM protein, partial [Erythrobacter sp.]